jgi:hypothetical protein
MIYLLILGFFLFPFFVYKYPKLSGKFLFKYSIFMFIVTILRLITFRISTPPLFPFNYTLFLVFWEDVIFVCLPLFILTLFDDGIIKKISTLLIWIAFSLFFAWGHLYQGYIVACITMVYPFFISKPIIEKHGLLTMSIVHVSYDVITVLTIYMFHSFVN